MIKKITLTPIKSLYQAKPTNSTPRSNYISGNLATDLFERESISVEKALKKIGSNIKESVIINLTDDADPLKILSNMSLVLEKLTLQRKMSLKFNYSTPDGGNCSIPVLTKSSIKEINEKAQKPEFADELRARIKTASLKELIPDDYHDSLD